MRNRRQEQPWIPGPEDTRFAWTLINPNGDRHLAFDDAAGRFYRLWQYQDPEPLHTGAAVCLRPSDIGQIMKCAMAWALNHPNDPRHYELVDEVADGVQYVVNQLNEAANR